MPVIQTDIQTINFNIKPYLMNEIQIGLNTGSFDELAICSPLPNKDYKKSLEIGTILNEENDTRIKQSFNFLNYDFLMLSYFYEIKSFNEVCYFVKRNLDIYANIIESETVLAEIFNDSKLKLELVNDVEQPEWQTLFIKVEFNGSPDDFNTKMELFIKKWLVNQSKKFRRLVSIVKG